MNKSTYRCRLLSTTNSLDLAAELGLIGVSKLDTDRLLENAGCLTIKLCGVRVLHSNALSDAFRAVGAEVVVGKAGDAGADIVILGIPSQYRSAIYTLKRDQLDAAELIEEIEETIEHGLEASSGQVSPIVTPFASDQKVLSEMQNRTLVMGILNVTTDSFSDGGRFFDASAAIRHGAQMLEDGADIIDVGGESTRPGSEPVGIEEEIRRVVPVITELRKLTNLPISIDTYHAAVAQAALDSGATIINDISGMMFDLNVRRVAACARCPVILMHIKGTPRDMQKNPSYTDLMGEIVDYLRGRIDDVIQAGVDEHSIIIDPGIGFGKLPSHNLEILRRLSELKSIGRPVLVGTSRKATIGHVLGGLSTDERLEGTAATVALSIASGASIVRVHDVKQMKRVVLMTDAILRRSAHH